MQQFFCGPASRSSREDDDCVENIRVGCRESQISAGEKWTFSDAFLDGADVIWRIR